MITQTALKKISHLITKGKFGLEKENLRVNNDGQLAITPHPSIFGDKSKNQYITTDFSESQIEMITPPLPSIEEAHDFIHTLNSVITNEIGNELLWPQSLPPKLPSEEMIPIAKYQDSTKEQEEYREKIAKVYGKYRQMICGIHFNISLADELFVALQKELGDNLSISDIQEEVYLKITRGMMRYRWMLIWMYSETPIAEPTFKVRSLKDDQERFLRCKSSIALRSGPQGYRNKDNYTLDFQSIEKYNQTVDKLVSEGKLNYAKELYLPIRMKFLAKDNGGPSYLELRFLDLDPLSPSGVNKEALYASHLMFLYTFLCEEKGEFGEKEQFEATLRQDLASCYGRCQTATFPEEIKDGVNMAKDVISIVQDMRSVLTEFGVTKNPIYAETLDRMEHLAKNPNERKGIILYEDYKKTGFLEYLSTKDKNKESSNDQDCNCNGEDKHNDEYGYINYHLNIAKKNKEESLDKGYRFWGREGMEMSTQLLMRAALCKGVGIEILDHSENFIRLNRDGNVQLVVQATKTNIDNYATVLAMENKVVTKKLLSENNIMVPSGGEYFSLEDALVEFPKYQNRAIVLKPKSTNFGIGITIIKDNQDAEYFEKALKFAFEHDNCVLVENFIEGREFRIFVIDNEVVAILHRVPANVEGDGVHTVRELVGIKNQDSRRGKGYHTPLEKLSLGKEEALFLEMQGESFDTIVKKGEKLYLRENSNISTGGDSLDFTDDVDDSYKAIAVEAAKAVKAKITGVDMMIMNIGEKSNDTNYSIIEINFNPAIHIHCFPYEGKNRKLDFKILKALGY